MYYRRKILLSLLQIFDNLLDKITRNPALKYMRGRLCCMLKDNYRTF